MNFPARLTRRFAIGSVALASVVASFAFTTGPARAATPLCFDANAQQVQNPNTLQVNSDGQIMQFGCDNTDPYQYWVATQVGVASQGGYEYGRVYTLENWGALNGYGLADCADADAQQITDGGAITQYPCNPSDPFQQWIVVELGNNGNGSITAELQNYGAFLEGKADCADADAQEAHDGGAITQYACDANDPYQLWTESGQYVDGQVIQNFQNIGA